MQWADGKYQLTGFLSQPIYSRHNRSGQYLFLNKRAVSSPLISYAIQDSYGTRLAAHQYPQFVLHFECPRELVDVNVHPQKKEVRSLFYNTPARKSFQKSAAANGAEITRMVTLLSLSYPHVHFELIQQEKNILVAPECKDSFDEALQQRMRQVLGEEFAK